MIVVRSNAEHGYVEWTQPSEAEHPAGFMPRHLPTPVYVGSGAWRMPHRFVGEVVAGLLDGFGAVRLERAA